MRVFCSKWYPINISNLGRNIWIHFPLWVKATKEELLGESFWTKKAFFFILVVFPVSENALIEKCTLFFATFKASVTETLIPWKDTQVEKMCDCESTFEAEARLPWKWSPDYIVFGEKASLLPSLFGWHWPSCYGKPDDWIIGWMNNNN